MTAEKQQGHTAGPWLVYEHCPAFKGEPTCIFAPSIPDAVICSMGHDILQVEANARLIASAPLLLEALQENIGYIPCTCAWPKTEEQISTYSHADDCARRKVLAAISAATSTGGEK